MEEQRDLFDGSSSVGAGDTALGIVGLAYVPDFLTSFEQESVLHEVDVQPWSNDLRRRVQHYGYRYDYKARRVDRSMYLGPLPAFAIPTAERLVQQALMAKVADQLIVNEYLPGQGITAHIDCEPCFGEQVAMVSLGWAYEMEFIDSETGEKRVIKLAPGSAVVVSGDARHKWLHQIKARKSDRGIPRKRRVSLTFRNVILDGKANETTQGESRVKTVQSGR
jgi:alkylated DNA repair dioxygenase AlkB